MGIEILSDRAVRGAIETINVTLKAIWLQAGYVWYSGKDYEYFNDASGEYSGYPNGYIRRHYTTNGSPRPYQAAVRGPNGWLVRSERCDSARDRWALEMSVGVLKKLAASGSEDSRKVLEALDCGDLGAGN